MLQSMLRLQFSIRFVLFVILLVALGLHFRFEIFGYPAISWQAYSRSLIDRQLDAGKDVLVVIRSNHSLWSNDWPNKNDELKRLVFKRKLACLELVYDWEDPSLATPFFDEFGYQKEAFAVLYFGHDDANAIPRSFTSGGMFVEIVKALEKQAIEQTH